MFSKSIMTNMRKHLRTKVMHLSFLKFCSLATQLPLIVDYNLFKGHYSCTANATDKTCLCTIALQLYIIISIKFLKFLNVCYLVT